MPSGLTSSDESVRLLGILVASSASPCAIDRLADSGCWRPSALLAAVDSLRESGLIELDAAKDHLSWRGDCDAVIRAANEADLEALARFPACLELLLGGARRAATERRFPAAGVLYRALVGVEPAVRSTFPGGEATWVALVREVTKLFRSAWPVEPAIYEAAVSFAEEHGDLATQAVLLAAHGVRALADDPDRARRLFDRALEAAEALDAPQVRVEVRAYIAVSLILSGRPGEGIAAFEALCGNVPGDLLDSDWAALLELEGAAPASALCLLANAYALTGAHPRAVDLMQRVAALGVELHNPALEAQGQVMLGLTFMIAGDRRAAARAAEAAAPWFATVVSPYSWACALTLAWARADEWPEEARAILARALPDWNRTGRFWMGGSRTLELLDQLAEAGVAPLEGLTVEQEVARHLDAPQPLLAGIAHRWAAKRAPSPLEAERHLARALDLLREAGGGPELELATLHALEAARRAGDKDVERALSAELSGRRGPTLGTELVRLASAVLDLGRLDALEPGEGVWGNVAARLGRDLGAERCAILIVEDDEAPRVLAARATPAWCEALLARAAGSSRSSPVFEAAIGPGLSDRVGQLILVPFDDGARRRGLLALENRDTTPRLTPLDIGLLAILGRQMSILFSNVELWRELQRLRQQLEQENRYHREAGPPATLGSGRIVGDSAVMREVLELVRRVAPSTTPVLVTGETGVGKELVSREVHLASERRAGPFIAVNIAALSPGLVASALFGHERGAFTGATERAQGRFELADGGTIFLDEVGELAPDDQVRLLRVLQEGAFERVGGTRPLRSDFRLVAATNRDLAAAVREGRFREDLYFRLAAFPIRVPPLRERREEIPTLALFFLEQVSRKLGLAFDGISERDMERLVQYSWPGNVRELMHVIERAVLLADPPRLRIPTLQGAGLPIPADARPAAPEEWVSLEEVERRYVGRVLHHVHGRVSGPGGAAELLQLKPSTLHFWIDRLGLRGELAKARKEP